jgi:hypothetical protein
MTSEPAQDADYVRPKGSEEEVFAHMVAQFGACTCTPDGCDEEGEPGCSLCQALDPYWPCPAEEGDDA